MYIDFHKSTPQYVRRFVENCVDYLKLRNLDADIQIYPLYTYSDELGWCYGDKTCAEVYYTTKGLSRKEKLMVIAHEMIHAKQILRRQLINEVKEGQELNRWRGGLVDIEIDIDTDDLEYLLYADTPWEREAYGREEEVYNACINNKK